MPQLLLRGVSRELVTAVREYARAREMSTPDAAAELLQRGLEDVRARQAGAAALNAARTPEQRSEAARAAVKARWARQRGGSTE